MILDQYYHGIPGWFDFQDLYTRAVNETGMSHIRSTFVEVGSFCGKSLAYMGVEIVNSGKRIDLHSVDHMGVLRIPKGFGEVEHERARSLGLDGFEQRAIVERNLRPCTDKGLALTVHNADAILTAKEFQLNSLDFVFLDAAHDYDGIKREIEAWLPRVRPGGVIAGHDHTKDYPGVIQAVTELLPGAEILRSSFWKRI